MPTASALPGLCSPGAAALGVAGLGSLCGVAGGAAGLAGSAVSQAAGAGLDGVLGALGSWVSQGAVWLLGQVGAVLTATTGVDLGASWFLDHYRTMAALCGVVVLPMLVLGIVQSVYRQDLSALLRSALVHLPLALLLTSVAVKLVQIGLSVTDDLSAAVAHGAGLDAAHFMASVSDALTGAPGQPAVPAFVVFLGGIAVVVGTFLVWIELLVRAAAVYVAVLFLPLALAALVWPAISHWCRRLVDTLVALVLAKFVIVSVLSLAAGALGDGSGSGGGGGPAGPAGPGGPGGAGGFAGVLGGAALLLLAGLAPWALLRLLPFVEADAAAHLEGLSHRARQAAKVPVRGLAQTALRAAAVSSVAGTAGLVLGDAAGSGGIGVGELGPGWEAGGGDDDPALPRSGAGWATGPVGGEAPAEPSHRGRPGERPARGRRLAGGIATGGDAPQGARIPRWEPDPEISELARHWDFSAPAAAPVAEVGTGARSPGPEAEPGPVPGSPAGTAAVPLGQQTGAAVVDQLEWDGLGARLVSRPALPPPPPPPATPSGVRPLPPAFDPDPPSFGTDPPDG